MTDDAPLQLPELFDGLSEQAIKSCWEHFHIAHVSYGTPLMVEGDTDPSLLYVAKGELEIRTGDVSLGRAVAGDIVGEMAMFGQGMRSANVETNTQAELYILDRSGYIAMRDQGHPLARRLEERALKGLLDRLGRADERIARRAEGTPVKAERPGPGFFAWLGQVLGGQDRDFFEPQLEAPPALARSEMFQGIAIRHLAVVSQYMSLEGWRKGKVLIEQGADSDRLFVLADGEVEVLLSTRAGGVQSLATLASGHVFGLGSILAKRPATATCVAKSDVAVLALDRATWTSIAATDNPVGTILRIAMIRALSAQLSYANGQLAMLEIQLAREEQTGERSGDYTPLRNAIAGVETMGGAPEREQARPAEWGPDLADPDAPTLDG